MSRVRTAPVRAAHLSAVDVHISRGGRPVLTGVDLSISAGERLAVVGENGSGKTTLLQVLSGGLVPDRGEVRRAGSFGVADQRIPLDPAHTVGDLIDLELAHVRNALRALDDATVALAHDSPGAEDDYAMALAVLDARDGWDADRRVAVSLAALGAVDDRSRTLGTLSVGQRHRVRLACLLGAGHDLLLLDEPTNHLDASGLAHLTERLREHPGVVVLVSHDRVLLADAATSVLDLAPSSDGRPRTYGGGYAGHLEGRRAERERWEALHREQITERQRLADDLSAARNRLSDGWRPAKGHGKHTRATRAPALVRAVHRRQEQLDAHTVSVPRPPLELAVPELPSHQGGALLSADEITVAGRLPNPYRVVLGSGDRLVVTGPNGGGKSTLLSVLAGRLTPGTGSVVSWSGLRIGYLGQESTLPPDSTAREIYETRISRLMSRGLLAESDYVALGALGLLDDRDAHRRVSELSVGAVRRLDLAMVLATRPHLLLLDEPTNHLSATLVDELTAALTTTEAAVVLATHDRQLLRDTTTWPRHHLH